MKKIILRTLAAGCLCLALAGCSQKTEKNQETPTATSAKETTKPKREEKVLTAEEQAALTPDEVLERFKAGNQRFLNNDLTERDHSAQVRASVLGQYPKAVVLSCLDSRIPVEDVFDRGIGDVFVARVAGNFVNDDILGSMEFGCKVAGAKLIIVMGHERCGAVVAAIDNVQLGNITGMLKNIQPAVRQAQDFQGEKTSKNEEFVTHVARKNVTNTMANITKRSPILKEMVAKNQLKIVGAIYDMETGTVEFMEPSPGLAMEKK